MMHCYTAIQANRLWNGWFTVFLWCLQKCIYIYKFVTFLDIYFAEKHKSADKASAGSGHALLCCGPSVFRPQSSQLARPSNQILRSVSPSFYFLLGLFVSIYWFQAELHWHVLVYRCFEEDLVSGGSAARAGGRELFSSGQTHALWLQDVERYESADILQHSRSFITIKAQVTFWVYVIYIGGFINPQKLTC